MKCLEHFWTILNIFRLSSTFSDYLEHIICYICDCWKRRSCKNHCKFFLLFTYFFLRILKNNKVFDNTRLVYNKLLPNHFPLITRLLLQAYNILMYNNILFFNNIPVFFKLRIFFENLFQLYYIFFQIPIPRLRWSVWSSKGAPIRSGPYSSMSRTILRFR